jgi:hypothetical protein
MEIKNVLRRGINDLIDDTESFYTLVSDLQDEVAELTPSERRFLDYLIPFRDKLVRDAPVIASVDVLRHAVKAGCPSFRTNPGM